MPVTNLIPDILNTGDKPLLQVTNLIPDILNAGDKPFNKPLTRYH